MYFFKTWSINGETFLSRKINVRYIENTKILTVAITDSMTNMIFMFNLFVLGFKDGPVQRQEKVLKLSGVDAQMCTFVVATPILRHV